MPSLLQNSKKILGTFHVESWIVRQAEQIEMSFGIVEMLVTVLAMDFD